MSASVDFTIAKVGTEEGPCELKSGGEHEDCNNRSSQDSGVAFNFSDDSSDHQTPVQDTGLKFSEAFLLKAAESGHGVSQQPPAATHGVVGGLDFSPGFRNNLNKPSPLSSSSGPNFTHGHRRSSMQPPGGGLNLPLSDMRRPSIVDTMNSNGGLLINQGKCEINLKNVSAVELEQLYTEASVNVRRGSCSLPNRGYSSKELEEFAESSWIQKSSGSMGGSAEKISFHSDTCHCLNTSRNWWSPKFNSVVLEKRLKETVVEFLRTRVRVALVFLAMFIVLWIVVFSANIPFSPPAGNATLNVETLNNELAIYSVSYSPSYVFGGLTLFLCTGVMLILTFTSLYAKFALTFSILMVLILMCASFALALSQYFSDQAVQGFLTLSFVAQFALTAVSILVIFTLSRLPIWLSVVLSAIYLIILEGLVGFATYGREHISFPMDVYINSLAGRIVLYIGLILAGVTTCYLLQVRQLATFWKIAQCVLSQKALDLERDLEEKTILSMMPKHFADSLLNVRVQMMFMIKQRAVQESQGSLDPIYQSISAPFNICNIDNVSILFADIVNFTEFSSRLSAADLVGILNAVFSMFDELVTKHKCEKISTLGDCYFCVSGCPEPEPKHADNCVNMGLAIIESLEDYRKRTGLPIEMRVGIHTGSVFCGVMGTRRFKFDVWSKDVRLANQIESCSSPGRVLVSQTTRSALSGTYVVEQATPQASEGKVAGMDLFFVSQSKSRTHAGATGLSGGEWRKKINTIDTVCKPDESRTVLTRKRDSIASIKSTTQKLLCPSWRQSARPSKTKQLEDDQHSSSSLMDIQNQFQRCTSYAELAVPQVAELSEDIIAYMEDQKVHFDTYFDPQLHLISLNFHEREWEQTYRNYGRDLDEGSNGELAEMELGYRITKLSYMMDTLALFANFIFIMIGSAVCLSSDHTFDLIWHAWVGIFLVGLFVEITVLVFVFAVFSPRWFPQRFAKFATFIINWYVRSIVAIFFIYYPMAVVGVTVTRCQSSDNADAHLARLAHVQMTFFVTITVLVSSITCMEVSHIVKFVGGFLSATFAVVMVLALNLSICIHELPSVPTVGLTTDSVPSGDSTESTDGTRPPVSDLPLSEYFRTYYTRHVAPEAIILLLLILILLAVVNRMSEVSVRLSFIGRIEASARRRCTRQLKVQAEWLLYNIIPPHVAYQLRATGKYSQNHECVGVMFASIVNFQQLMHSDENKGESSLRLLNTIISEFDTLLERDRFTSVEKIKTIGSTYMAASGLNLPSEDCSVPHLLDLIEFGHQLVEILKQMNSKVDEFVFEMQIGFNYGPVTAGVVGSRKMLYDIWGDTVNVASRMASTGAVNEIQMPEQCLEKLAPYVKTHALHKVINIKGKGEMRTVLIRPSKSEKPSTSFFLA